MISLDRRNTALQLCNIFNTNKILKFDKTAKSSTYYYVYLIQAIHAQSITQFYSVDFSKSRIDVKKSAFSTNAQSRFASVVVDGVLGPPRLARHTWRCPCISVVPEATHEASRGPEKGAVSAQKALRGSETETRELLGGTEENSVSPMRGHWFALQANQWFFTKRKQEKIELVAKPGIPIGTVYVLRRAINGVKSA